MAEDMLESIVRVFLFSDHKSIAEAIAADVVDMLPVVGEVCNLTRIVHSLAVGNYYVTALQIIDLLVTIYPELGKVIDILLPANTVAYILKHGEEIKIF